MRDSKFSFWISSIFLIPLIPQLLLLPHLIFSIINKTSINQDAISIATEFLFEFGSLFLISFLLVNYVLFLTRKNYQHVKLIAYIFLLPELFVFWGLYDSFKGFPYSGASEDGLGLLIILPFLFILFIVFLFYYYIIMGKISTILKRNF